MAEPIGEIPVQITGDATELEKALADAIKKSEDGAEKISRAFAASFQGSEEAFNQFTSSMGGFSQTADAIINKQKELDTELIKARGALVEVQLAYEAGAVSVNTLVRAQDEVAAAAARANVAFDDSTTHLKSWGETIKEWIEHPLQSAQGAAVGFVESFGVIGVVAVAAGAGILELGKMITELVLEEGAAAEATSNLANKLNIGFEDMKKLSEMSKIAGVSVDGLARVSMRLATALEDPAGAGSKVAKALGEMGIGATDSGEALLQLLSKLAEIPDATERIAKAHEIMGRSSVELEPLLRDYTALSQAVDDLGGKLSGEAVDALKKADDAADKLGISWSHLKENLASTFAPAVTAAIDELTKLLAGPPQGNIDAQMARLSLEINQLEKDANSASSAFERWFQNVLQLKPNNAILEQKKQLLEMMDGMREATARSKEYNEELDKSNALALVAVATEKERAEAAKKAVAAVKARQKADDDAYKALLDAQKKVTDRQSELNSLLGEFGVKSGSTQIAKWTADLEKLNIAAMRGEISWRDFNNALDDFHKKSGLSLDLEGIARSAAILFDELHKMGLKDLTNDFMHSETAAAALKDTLAGMGTPVAAEFMSISTAARVLRISVGEAGEATTQAVSALESYLRNSQSLPEVELAWNKASSAIRELAETDLPKFIAINQKYIDKLKEGGETAGKVYGEEVKALAEIIHQRELAGKDATKEIVQMDQKIRKMKELSDAARRLGDMYVQIGHEFDKLFDARKLIDTLGGALFDTSKNKELEQSIKDLNQDLKEAALNWADVQREAARALEEIVADHAKAQKRIQEDAAMSLRDATIDYRRFVEDAREDLRKAQQAGDAEQVHEIQKQLKRRAEDYAIYVSDLKKATEQKLQDDREAQAKETKQVEDNLAKQKVSYDAFVAATTAKIAELTDAMTNAFERIGNAFKDMLKGFVTEVGKLVASTILQGYLDSLKKKITSALFPDAEEGVPGSGLLSKIMGGGAGGGASPVNVPGEMPPGGDVSLPGGGASGAAGGLGGLSGALDMGGGIAAIATAAMTAYMLIVLKRMEKDLARVEVTTRGMLNEIGNLRSDEWTREGHLMAKLDDMWNEIRNVVEILRLMGQSGGFGGGKGDPNLGQAIADAINSRPHQTGGSDGPMTLEDIVAVGQQSVDAANEFSLALETTASQAYELDAAVSDTTDGLYYLNEAVTGFAGSLPGIVDGMDRAVFNSMAQQQGQPGQNLSPGGPRMNATPIIMPVPVPDALTGPGGVMQGATMGHSNSQISYPTIAPVVGGPGVQRGGQQALVTVYAVDPSGRQVANATIQGLEERGIRVR